jgi:hypothetical protein
MEVVAAAMMVVVSFLFIIGLLIGQLIGSRQKKDSLFIGM